MAVAWSGSCIAAKTVINDVIDKHKSKPFNLDLLVVYLKSIDPIIKRMNFSLIFLICDTNNPQGILVGYNTVFFESKLFGKVFSSGNGTRDFVSIFSRVEERLQSFIGSDSALSAVPICTTIASLLLIGDFTDRKSLQQFYGGGYEIAGVDQGKVFKETDLNYVFWRTRLESDGSLKAQLINIQNYSYVGDILLIRTIRLDQPGPGEDGSIDFQVVQPINRTYTVSELSNILKNKLTNIENTFVSGHFVNCIIHEKPKANYEYFQINRDWPPLSFKPMPEPNKLNVHINQQFINDIVSIILGKNENDL